MKNDLTIYSDYANEWWQPNSPRFRSLQRITPFRLELISEMLGPLADRDVVDVGCGGGLISIPLLNQGARVIGIDISEPSIAAARQAAEGRGEFLVGSACSLPLEANVADAVILADVLDHIPTFSKALAEAARVVRPGGTVFVGTINRTIKARLLAIVLGEGLRLIPPGTHDYRLFLTPDEVQSAALQFGLVLERTQGETPEMIQTILGWAITLGRSSSCAVAYSLSFRKATA